MVYQDQELNQVGGINPGNMTAKLRTQKDRSLTSSQRISRPIKVNGPVVQVGPNLDQALRTLREIPETKAGKRIWIDSLCINQADLVEKSQQVKRMGNIYSEAERVVSWLGEDVKFAGELLECMNAIGGSILAEEEYSSIEG
jgi:hypothetical protein